MSARYVDMLGAASPSVRGGTRAYDILAALTPPPKPEASSTALAKPDTSTVKRQLAALAPGVLGGAVGATFWGEHRVLGFLLGMAVGDSAWEYQKGSKKRALCNVGVAVAGVAGALYAEKHTQIHPALAWAAGEAAGVVATALLVEGSPARSQLAKLKARL